MTNFTIEQENEAASIPIEVLNDIRRGLSFRNHR